MDTLTHLLVILSVLNFGLTIEDSRDFIVEENANIQLDCTLEITIDDILNGDASFTWTKAQATDWSTGAPDAETLDLNNGAALADDLPQNMINHLDFKYIQTPGEQPVNLQLDLKNIRREDSGQYMCTTSKNNAIVASVTYSVKVLTQMTEVIIYSVPDARDVDAAVNTSMWTHQNSVALGTRTPGYLACVVRGGYPAPVVTVTVGERTITGLMPVNEVLYWLMGDMPFEGIYRTTRIKATRSFPVNLEENGAKITCTAAIDNGNNQAYQTLSNTATLMLNAAPMFRNCSSFKSPIGAKNFELRCEFISVPAATKVEWKALVTGEIVSRRDGANGDFTASMETAGGEENVFVAILRIGTVGEIDFQDYRLTVGNLEGQSEFDIRLSEGEAQGATQTGNIHLSSLLTLFIVLATAAILS